MSRVDEQVRTANAAATRLLTDWGRPDLAYPPPLQDPEWIELPGRAGMNLATFCQAVGGALRARSAPLFRREDLLVTIERDSGLLEPMEPERFLSWILEYVTPFQLVEAGNGPEKQSFRVQRPLPLSIAKACLKADPFRYQMRALDRVHDVRMPVLRRSGEIELLAPGYDPETKIYTRSSEIEIDESMTIEAARAVFEELLRGFRWAEGDDEAGLNRSRAVAVAAALALFALGLQEPGAARMGFVFRSNRPGGGKSLLAQMAIAPCHGLPRTTPMSEEQELKKVLDTCAMQGATYLFMDNLKKLLDSPLIEAFMTGSQWSGRRMNTQRSFGAIKSTIVYITGNNLMLSPDLQRRVLQCDVAVEEFDLSDRVHAQVLNPVVLSRPTMRARILSAMWAIVRHWDRMGRPPAGLPDRPYRASTFEEWSDLIGGMVQSAGFGNPLVPPIEEKQADQKTVHQRKLVSLLATPLTDQKPREEYVFQDLVDCCDDHDLFEWMFSVDSKRVMEEGEEKLKPGRKDKATFSRMIESEMCEMWYRLAPGVRVRFGKQGANRQRRYFVEKAE